MPQVSRVYGERRAAVLGQSDSFHMEIGFKIYSHTSPSVQSQPHILCLHRHLAVIL